MTDKKCKIHKARKQVMPGLLSSAGLPPDACGSLPYIVLTGDRCAEIEHHCGILQLSPECIRLYSRMGIIRITGKDMTVTAMNGERISIKGGIRSAAFE